MSNDRYVQYVTTFNRSDHSESPAPSYGTLDLQALTTPDYATFNGSSNVTGEINQNFVFIIDARLPLYCIIFILSILGNSLVIHTLVQNRRMRTVTNVFLLNLSLSDLLLSVLCMPFTLIPTLMQNFIFGKHMCIIVRYLQGKSLGQLQGNILRNYAK